MRFCGGQIPRLHRVSVLSWWPLHHGLLWLGLASPSATAAVAGCVLRGPRVKTSLLLWLGVRWILHWRCLRVVIGRERNQRLIDLVALHLIRWVSRCRRHHLRVHRVVEVARLLLWHALRSLMLVCIVQVVAGREEIVDVCHRSLFVSVIHCDC